MHNLKKNLISQVRRKTLLFSFMAGGLLLIISVFGVVVQSHFIDQQKSVLQLHSIISSMQTNVHKTALLADNIADTLSLGEQPEPETHEEFSNSIKEFIYNNQRLGEWLDANGAQDRVNADDFSKLQKIHDQLRAFRVTAELLDRNLDNSGSNSVRVVQKRAEGLWEQAQMGLSDLLTVAANRISEETEGILGLVKVIGMATIMVCLGVAVLIWTFIFQPMLKMIFDQHENLVQSVIEAQAASRAKTEFLANISHEIRTPMTAILGYSEVLNRGVSSKGELDMATKIIHKNAEHLLNLIDEILDVSKIEAGNIQVFKQKTYLRQLVNEVFSLLHVKAAEKGIGFNVFAQGPIPEIINTDPVRLKQILFNIIGNAIKFTSAGSVKVFVRMVAGTGNGEDRDGKSNALEFLVKDTGVGIPEELRPRLFQPFIQADSSHTRRYKGTGLGLVLSKKMAQKLGGDVMIVESKVGVGSAFSIRIDPGPLELSAQAADVAQTSMVTEPQLIENGSGVVRPILKGANILVVDDAVENARLFKIYLERAQAAVDLAGSGSEALKLAESKDYDLIFLDLQMPEKDGFTVLRELRAMKCRSPIVALTAHAMAEEVARTRRAGFDDHVPKPVSFEKLVSVAGRYVGESLANTTS